MLKPLSEQVMVITGASSGIGLAVARMAAAKGAKVVLAARSAEVLERVAREIEAERGQALAVPTDVADRAQVEALARAAVERFGRIDTWINDAGVSVWGRIDETPEADMRQLFDVNFWGVVHGSLAALPHLRESRGALINVGSLGSDYALPLQGVYSASKHAVKGFTDALRTELKHEGAQVSVTLIKPAGIGTPLARHARNHVGREARIPPPIYSPREAARVILRAATHPMRDAFVGGAAPMMSATAALAPRLMDLVAATVLYGIQQGKGPPQPGDNLYQGLAEGEEHDAEAAPLARLSLYSRATNSSVTPLLAAGLALGAAVLAAGRGRAQRRY